MVRLWSSFILIPAEKLILFRSDFQYGVSFNTEEAFWSSFGDSLRTLNPHIPIPFIKSAQQFCNEFLTDKTLFGGKPVVMFIDEFDKLYNVALDEVTNSVLDTFRSLKNNKRQHSLHVC